MTTINAHSSSQRQRLPQINGNGLFVTDGGLETELVFHEGIDLPSVAAFPLLEDPGHRARLRRYYDGYLDTHASSKPVSSSRHLPGARTPTGVLSSATRPSSSTPPTVRRWRSQRRSGRLRRPTASPWW